MNKEDIRLIALDLDDTTLKSDGTLDEETKAAIKRAIEKGIEVVVASGRAFTALPKEITEIPGINYAVTLNGSSTYEIREKKKIVSYVLGEEAVKELLKIQKPYDEIAAVEVFIEGVPYTSYSHVNNPEKHGCSPAYVNYVKTTRIPVEDLEKFINDNISVIDSFVIACADIEVRNSIRTRIVNEVKGVKFTSSVKHLTEVIHENAGKSSGLKYICDILRIKSEQTLAVGNADNDIAMMEFAGIGVAVSNGSRKCLEAADIIIGNNNDNSVAKLINTICDYNVVKM